MRQVAAIAGLLALAAPASASQEVHGRFDAFGASITWVPQCVWLLPQPPVDRSDNSRRIYFEEAAQFADCVNAQAEEDAEGAVRAVKEGRDAAILDVQTEAKSLWR